MEVLATARSDSCISNTSDSPSARTSSTPKAQWEDNTSQCGLCQAKLGKRHMKPRHHCRICGLCVCASCSPSSVQLPGVQGLQRACSRCISNAQKVPKITHEVARLGEHLTSSFGLSRSLSASTASGEDASSLASSEQQSWTGSFEDAVAFCEKAVDPIREEHRKTIAAKELQAQQLEAARRAFLRLGQKIHSLSGSQTNYTWTSELQFVSLEEAAALCEKALSRLETVHRSNKDLADVHLQASAGGAAAPTAAPVAVAAAASPSSSAAASADQADADCSQAVLPNSEDTSVNAQECESGRPAGQQRARIRSYYCRLLAVIILASMLVAALAVLLWRDVAPAVCARLGPAGKAHAQKDLSFSPVQNQHHEMMTAASFLHRW
mmetsp:Transcript_119913/g.208207  ORF Transcript_119913/g.208207 Transcript_119913/m.208207 type:complete len:381 (-) Transcript_119913:153-1295(-)